MSRLRLAVFAMLAAVLLLSASWEAAAVEPDEVLDDPVLEQRARALSAELRCMVCQNQSIDDSDAPLAKDLRVLVRERLEAGDSDAEVVDYLAARFGEFVLLKPRVSAQTYLLWATPVLVLALGLVVVAVMLRRGRTSTAPAASSLTAEEEQEIQRVLASRKDHE